jgi:hypothetical protein
VPSHSNPNGEDGAMPGAETMDPFLAKQHSQLGFCSAPVTNKHQISDM